MKNSERTIGKKRENAEMQQELLHFLEEEDGVGVVEVILILVVLIGVVAIFRKKLEKLVTDIFKTINTKTKAVY